MESKITIANILKICEELLSALDLSVNHAGDIRSSKKINEVAGFCEQIIRIIETDHLSKELTFLDCSCGKSYLSFALNHVLTKFFSISTIFYGVDKNQKLIEKCNQVSKTHGFSNMHFSCERIIDVQPEKPIDILIALHACDVATDEAIAKGIKLGVKYIVIVPCCENQIRSRLKMGHHLVDLTNFGLLRYRFADILTEALRAQFLSGNGYHVKLVEIVPPKITPKNLMIIARRKKGNRKRDLSRYDKLDEMFNTKFVLKDFFIEQGRQNLNTCDSLACY